MKAIILFFILSISITSFGQMQPYDLIIDEIMPDPSPVVNLPDAEFIELKNTSGHPINLIGCKISTSSSISGSLPSYTLPADSFIILTATSNITAMKKYGRALSVSGFPAIINTGTILSIISSSGKTIHAVHYSNNWYQNPIKAMGGWTLEMIDTHNPCSGINNWKASIDPGGGTPGKKNSIDALNADQTPPQVLRSYSIDSITLVILFDEPIDSFSASNSQNYLLINGPQINYAIPQGPIFDKVLLKMSSPLSNKKVYTLMVNNVIDCKGNVIGLHNQTKTGIEEGSQPKDLIINEILFNPRPNASDYVELYNKNNKIINASRLFLATRDAAGTISSAYKLSDDPLFIFPGDYMVITSDKASLLKEYLVKEPSAIQEITTMPSYPDDKGTVLITNAQGEPVDEVSYSKSWHFPLINDPQGVSLERIDPSGPSQDQNNWHSAASTSGYGTPTYQNSQFKQIVPVHAVIDIVPKLFSPDNDGVDDIVTITYKTEVPGYFASIYIFNAKGIMVRYLVKNDLLGSNGKWVWDGLDGNGQKLPIGIYIIFTELFNLEGRKKQFKNSVVLARKY